MNRRILIALAALLALLGYSRSDYPHWRAGQVWGDGLNACEEILAERSLVESEITDRMWSKHVTAGQWTDEWTGETITDPNLLQCDHVIPLAEADRSGAPYLLSRKRRVELANDPRNVALTLGSLNASRGAADFGEWSPPNEAIRCEYVRRWIEVKTAYGLPMDWQEGRELVHAASGCLD